MTEAEVLGSAIQAAEAATAIYSLFFSIVSAYIAGLYFFLNTAPMGLRFTAFLLLTISFATLAALGWNLQYLGEGMHSAWQNLPNKTTDMVSLGPPIIVRSLFFDGRRLAFLVGWTLGVIVYVALAYMTFIYRWPKKPMPA
jgi:hypothetical protein